MLESLQAIDRLMQKDNSVLKSEKWLRYLALTKEYRVNLERVYSLADLKDNYTLRYVERTLQLLEDYPLRDDLKVLAEDTLCWAEVAKAGLPHQRQQWIQRGYTLYVHNIGSAQIYDAESGESDEQWRHIVRELIATHGLIGQSIRGEVPLKDNEPLYRLVEEKRLSSADLQDLLAALNCCIIAAVSEPLWQAVCGEAEELIAQIVAGRFDRSFDLQDKLRRLRSVSIQNGETFDEAYATVMTDPRLVAVLSRTLERVELWYVEAALYDFSLEEFIKILLFVCTNVQNQPVRHISFERLMQAMYYQHEGRKRINIYKKRILEKYLSVLTFHDILVGRYPENYHVQPVVEWGGQAENSAFFTFRFSPAGAKLIEFCVEAEKSGVLYEKAIVLLFDLFDWRRDAYDRFYEEESYLTTMNQTIDYKSVLLEDIVGERVIDIGPGGGALMDLIEQRFPEKTVIGVDIARNVLDALSRRKQLEHKNWSVRYGDALNLGEVFPKDGADTIIFCSILHELFSYVETDGRKFNHKTLELALQSAFGILPVGGRILIRDGIMTEPVAQQRRIRFLSEEGMAFLARYASDFKGRAIVYEVVGHNEVKMPINDAMEFLYTYTWGESSYVHEVQEQFGYFTPSEYRAFVQRVLGANARIVKFRHFLQDGYTLALSQKIEFRDESGHPARLPDSTCILVIEKMK